MLRFVDEPRLRDTSVLNPHWVTDGVYRLLRAKDGPGSDGTLTLTEEAWAALPGNTDAAARFLLWLIPELLPPNEPAHGIRPETSLNLEYHYSYLPTGLMPRFIVRMHNAVAEQTCWKNGVVLRIDGCRVVVRSSREEKKVFVSVEGRQPASRRALAVVRQNLASVHAGMRHLVWQEMVSLPDDPTVTISYNDLEQYEKDEGPHYAWHPPGASASTRCGNFWKGLRTTGSRRTRRWRPRKRPCWKARARCSSAMPMRMTGLRPACGSWPTTSASGAWMRGSTSMKARTGRRKAGQPGWRG